MCTPLHERLRLAREHRGLPLQNMAREWGVREQNLALIEQDAFEDLPSGLYGRAAVRAYAAAVGLAPDEALAEVIHRLRVPEDPLDGLARVHGLSRQPAQKPRKEAVEANTAPPSRGQWRPQAAAATDAALLLAIDGALLQMTALVAGVSAGTLIRAGAPSLVLLYALIAGLYFVLLGGIGGGTPGVRLAQALPEEGAAGALDIQTALERGLRYARREGSSLIKWPANGVLNRDWLGTRRLRRAWGRVF
jgi:hypothetical protein